VPKYALQMRGDGGCALIQNKPQASYFLPIICGPCVWISACRLVILNWKQFILLISVHWCHRFT